MAKNRSANRSRRNRKSRRASRRSLNGGYDSNNASPLELNDTSMMSPQRLSIGQGNQFADLTKNMHGGMGVYPGSVTDSALPQNLHASARLLALDQKYAEIANMSDQAGGRRRRRKASRKSRKASRKSRKASRKNRKASRKNRKTRRNRRQMGGATLGYAPTDAPGMLLDAAQTARAGLNPEWKLAEDVNSFTPK